MKLRMYPTSLNGNVVAKDEFGYTLRQGCGFNAAGVDTIQFCCRGNKNRICSIPLTLGDANYAETYPRWHWDGNMQEPTIEPSIGCDNRCGWHGSITSGEIRP